MGGFTAGRRGEDQRRTERCQTALVVRYGAASIDRCDTVADISEGGVCIRTNDVYAVGTRLQMLIEFPDRTVHQRGEVMWAIRVPEHLRDSMLHGMGIQFLDPEPGWSAYFRDARAQLASKDG